MGPPLEVLASSAAMPRSTRCTRFSRGIRGVAGFHRCGWWTPWASGRVLGSTEKAISMTVTFNHTIIAARDKNASAAFYRELLELPEAPSWGPFVNVLLDEGVLLQFAEPPLDIQMQHY